MRRWFFREKSVRRRKAEKAGRIEADSASAGTLQDRPGGGFDRADQFNRREGDSVAGPTQNPALNFRQAGESQAQLNTAVLQLDQLLRRMPALFADVIGDKLIKTDHDIKFTLPGDDAETVAQPFSQGKFPRANKRFAGGFDS